MLHFHGCTATRPRLSLASTTTRWAGLRLRVGLATSGAAERPRPSRLQASTSPGEPPESPAAPTASAVALPVSAPTAAC